MSRSRRDLLRYAATVALGLAVDLALARAALALGVPIALAAVLGVAGGAAFNYAMLAGWVFPGAGADGAIPRPLRYLGALAATMAVRALGVSVLSAVLPGPTPPLVILGAAVGISFALNFLLSKHWVFRRGETAISPSGD